MNPDATARLQCAIGIKVTDAPLEPPRGADPDWYAAQLAIQAGADFDAPLIGASLRTLLPHACRWNRMAVARWLLDRGADPNATAQGGYLPLSDAVAHGHTKNERNVGGGTILTVVAMGLSPVRARAQGAGLIGALLDTSADPSCIDAERHTVPEIFADTGRHDLLMILNSELAHHRHATVHRRLLDKMSTDQGVTLLPRSCAAEASAKSAQTWLRWPQKHTH